MFEEPHTNSVTETCEGDEINLLRLLLVIVRRKMLIVKICTAAIVLSVCYSLTLKNIYTATCKFCPPPRDSSFVSFVSMLTQSGSLQGLGGFGGSSDIYLAIAKSRSVADAVVKHLDLQREYKAKNSEAARKAAEGAVKFESGKDGIITVSANSTDPQKAALLANAFVDETIKRTVQLYLTKAGSERQFLEHRLETSRVELKNAESDLKAFQEEHKSIKADTQASVAIEGIARIRAEIVTKEVQLATLRNSMTDESSEVKALQAGIARLKSQMGAMSGSGGGDNVIPTTGNVPSLTMEYLRKLRDVKIQEAIFEQLSKQYGVAKINETKDSSSVQIIDEAVAPLTKSGPKRSLIVILSTVTAFILSLGYIFIEEYLCKRFSEDTEIIGEIKQTLRYWK